MKINVKLRVKEKERRSRKDEVRKMYSPFGETAENEFVERYEGKSLVNYLFRHKLHYQL
jgi:hypothetical protein